jgi:hypothetical protein
MSNEQESIKVQVGQRWREADDRPFYTVTRQRGSLFAIAFDGDKRGDDGPMYPAADITRDTFVGWAPGYGPQPPTARIDVEIAVPSSDRWTATHIAWDAISGWDKRERNTATGNIERSSLWRDGRYVVELPPSRALAPTIKGLIAPKDPERLEALPFAGLDAWLPKLGDRFTAPREWSSQGVARVGDLTALQKIQARKPPEPWRPSVDEYDLLPDVDVRR